MKLNQPKVRSNAVSVSWEYQDDISDLQAFVVLVNGNPKPVTGSQQNVVLENMPRGNYAIEVQAQTKSGVKSPPSTRRFVTVK